jgi:filamentous hemagglutinin
MDMYNYGNANTNTMSTEQWLSNNSGSAIFTQGNQTLRNNITSAANGNGTVDALFKEMGIAAITTTLKIAGLEGKEVKVEGEGNNVFATAGDAIYGIAGLNKQGQKNLEDDVKQSVHAGEEYNKLDRAVSGIAYNAMSNPLETLSAIGNMPLNILDGINRNPLETIFTTEGYKYAIDEYNQGYYLTAMAGLAGALAIDSPMGAIEKQAGKTVIKETAEAGIRQGVKETAEAGIINVVDSIFYVTPAGMAISSAEKDVQAFISLQDFYTPTDRAVFYSGGTANRRSALDFITNQQTINNEKYYMLKDTAGGIEMNKLLPYKDFNETFPSNLYDKYWGEASRKFSQQASGIPTAFVEGASDSSIFKRIEVPTLAQNKNINGIKYEPTNPKFKGIK